MKFSKKPVGMSAKKFEIIWFASNGKTYSISWIHKQRHPDPTVSGLADKLYKHHIGGW